MLLNCSCPLVCAPVTREVHQESKSSLQTNEQTRKLLSKDKFWFSLQPLDRNLHWGNKEFYIYPDTDKHTVTLLWMVLIPLLLLIARVRVWFIQILIPSPGYICMEIQSNSWCKPIWGDKCAEDILCLGKFHPGSFHLLNLVSKNIVKTPTQPHLNST